MKLKNVADKKVKHIYFIKNVISFDFYFYLYLSYIF